jgi:hypothetical protein
MEHYSMLRINELWSHEKTQKNLKYILNETNQSEKVTNMIPTT